MLSIAIILALAAGLPNDGRPAGVEPRVIQCTATNTAAGTNRQCHVKIPRGASVRACDATEKVANHCTLDARMGAWTANEKGAECKLSKKKTDWAKRVTVKVAKRTKPGAGSCTLFVGTR